MLLLFEYVQRKKKKKRKRKKNRGVVDIRETNEAGNEDELELE